jgi:hypothetical protein
MSRKNKANQTQTRLAPRPALGVEKTKPIIPFSVRRSEFSVKTKKVNLKKQTQFLKGQIGVKHYLKGT